jgi:two-component system chemotaxis response regulator CheB
MNQFASSLNQIGNIKVKIAENSELIRSGIAYLAPGDNHMEIILKNNKPFIRIFDAEKINFCKPSIDPLFFSAAHIFKNHVMGIILTGLGYDGVAGLEAIRSEGGETIAEARETSIVYGMPRVAAESGAARYIIPNYQIKDKMIAFAKKTIISEN